MMEFIIARTDGQYWDLNYNQFPDVLHPNSVPWIRITGRGDDRIEVEGSEVSFSDEPPGIQVSFETGNIEPEYALKLVLEILENVEKATGQHGEVIEI